MEKIDQEIDDFYFGITRCHWYVVPIWGHRVLCDWAWHSWLVGCAGSEVAGGVPIPSCGWREARG